MDNLRFIDADSHVLETEEIWSHYLEKKYRRLIRGHARWIRNSVLDGEAPMLPIDGKRNPMRFELEVEVMGQRPLGDRDSTASTRGFEGQDLEDLDKAYGKWVDQDFPASAYREVMDTHGSEHMILYPTVGFWTTASADMDGETAIAIRRAYNRWLGDYCQDIGSGACGAASIDLRDPILAAEEVRRCVKAYDFKAVHLNPAPVPGIRPFDEECDVLWQTCADLGVPIGLHPSSNHPFDSGLLDYLPGLKNCHSTVSFVLGSMLACTSFIMGGVLERHPTLKLVFLESGCGWAAFWLDRLEAGIQGGSRRLKIQGLNLTPREYFQRQCFVAADQDDPGIEHLIDAIDDSVILGATDFGHQEGRYYYKAKQD